MKPAQNNAAIVSMLFAALLSGCSTVTKVEDWLHLNGTPSRPPTAASVSPPATTATTPPKPKHQEREPREQKEATKTAAIDPNSLIGLDPPAVAKLLGPPGAVAKGEPSLVWTYIATGCTFRIFFYPDLKTASFHALKYGGFDGNGEQIGLSQPCIRSILTVRVNGSG